MSMQAVTLLDTAFVSRSGTWLGVWPGQLAQLPVAGGRTTWRPNLLRWNRERKNEGMAERRPRCSLQSKLWRGQTLGWCQVLMWAILSSPAGKTC